MRDPGGGGSGFSVDPATLDGAAGQLGRAYDDFQTVITDFAGTQCYDAAAFGDFGMGPAWQAFNSAWAGELGVTSAALAELTKKVSTTAENYRANEHAVRAAITAAGTR